MPNVQMLAIEANERLSLEGQAQLSGGQKAFLNSGRLSDIARGLLPRNADKAGFLDRLPEGVQEAIRAGINSAVNRAKPIPVIISWEDSFGYGAMVREAVSVDGATTCMDIRIYTPYQMPADGPGSRP